MCIDARATPVSLESCMEHLQLTCSNITVITIIAVITSNSLLIIWALLHPHGFHFATAITPYPSEDLI